MKRSDFLIGAANVGFAVALLPSVFGPDKPDFYTSLGTALLLSFCVCGYAEQRLPFATAYSLATMLLWFTLAMQSLYGGYH